MGIRPWHVKWAVVMAITVMPLIASAADPLPIRPNFNHYQPMSSRSPFVVATTIPATTPHLAKDFYLTNIAWTEQGCIATFTSTADKNFKKEVWVKRPVERDFNDIYLDLRP